MKKIYLLCAFLIPVQLAAQGFISQFRIPIQGTHLQDYFLVNYVDWSLDSTQDFHCGNKTYDGHQGTDFTLRNFAQMDAGVEVYAAKDGVVSFLVDTFFDRNKTALSGGLGNYVAIRHFDGFYSYYGHLKKGSVTVQVGDLVAAGQKIGAVGSSGYSSDPHLHFEVWYDSLYYLDPFAGPCGNPGSLWLDSLNYIDQFGLIDHDFSNFVPTLDTLKERLPGQSVFTPADPFVNFWMQGYGVFPGDVSTVKWYDPTGNLWFQFDYQHEFEWWYYYFWTYIDMPPLEKAGLWRVEYSVNQDLKITDHFTVSGASAAFEAEMQDLVQVFQDQYGNLVLQKQEAMLADDVFDIVDMTGRLVIRQRVEGRMESIILPVSGLLDPGIYVLYSRHGQFRPQRFLFVR